MAGSHEMRPAAPGLKLTYDDFVQFPDDGKRHELIDGEHYVTASPNTRHQQVSGTLFGLIWTYLQTQPVGRLFTAPYDVVFSEVDVVEPDLVFIANAGSDIITPQHVRGAPDLVVEIGSPSTRGRDETIKRRLYERAGVEEYWLVDPEIEVVRVYRRRGESPVDERQGDRRVRPFARPKELSREAGDVLQTPLLPGLDLPLSRIFAD